MLWLFSADKKVLQFRAIWDTLHLTDIVEESRGLLGWAFERETFVPFQVSGMSGVVSVNL